MVHQIKQEEKDRVIEAVREWLKNNIHEREFNSWNGCYEMYYDLCVTKHDTEEEFWNAFDEFVKTL